jgi:hypothetical protein
MFQAFTRKIPGSKPVVRAEIILAEEFRLSLCSDSYLDIASDDITTAFFHVLYNLILIYHSNIPRAMSPVT